MTTGMWNSYPFALVKTTVFGLPSLLFLVRYSCEQQESNLVPIIGALPDGQSVQDCSVAICMRNYWELTASPCSELSSPIKRPCNEGTWGGSRLNSFIPWKGDQALHTEQTGGLRDTVHRPCSPGLCSLLASQWCKGLRAVSSRFWSVHS